MTSPWVRCYNRMMAGYAAFALAVEWVVVAFLHPGQLFWTVLGPFIAGTCWAAWLAYRTADAVERRWLRDRSTR